MEALAPTLALELVLARVNAVSLGLMETPLLPTVYDAERDTIVKNRAAILPGRRMGTAEEVAEVILTLMTNAYVTGEWCTWMGAVASCHNARSVIYTIDGHTVPLLPRATYVQQPCRPPEVTVHWPGTQLEKTVPPNHGDRYIIVRADAGAFRIELG